MILAQFTIFLIAVVSAQLELHELTKYEKLLKMLEEKFRRFSAMPLRKVNTTEEFVQRFFSGTLMKSNHENESNFLTSIRETDRCSLEAMTKVMSICQRQCDRVWYKNPSHLAEMAKSYEIQSKMDENYTDVRIMDSATNMHIKDQPTLDRNTLSDSSWMSELQKNSINGLDLRSKSIRSTNERQETGEWIPLQQSDGSFDYQNLQHEQKFLRNLASSNEQSKVPLSTNPFSGLILTPPSNYDFELTTKRRRRVATKISRESDMVSEKKKNKKASQPIGNNTSRDIVGLTKKLSELIILTPDVAKNNCLERCKRTVNELVESRSSIESICNIIDSGDDYYNCGLPKDQIALRSLLIQSCNQ